MSAKEKCEDKKDESEECKETDGIQYSDNDINNFINKAKKIMLERYCELENGSLRKDDEERDNIRRYILQKYPTVVEKYKSHHNREFHALVSIFPAFFRFLLEKYLLQHMSY